jgi:hypothetical protein
VRELQLLYGTIADEIVTDYCRSEHVYALIRRTSRYNHDPNPPASETVSNHGSGRQNWNYFYPC